ncbi:unnamed protein product [Candidula unifasciata]|uniref:MAM domain-containing protein n=1 Tax=Candidula unifasciata TaxID=100452 RepID=A0A8S3YU72_9EUPU|nr:unnamed protein product [Candidula unifasciata]
MLGYSQLLSISAILLVIWPSVLTKKGCSFKHGGCTYNIQLNHNKHSMGRETGHNECGNKEQQVYLDSTQSDYTSKIDDMEKNFSFLRDAHEQRLKVSLCCAILQRKKGGRASDVILKSVREMTKTIPLSFLYTSGPQPLGRDPFFEEFAKLKQELKKKTSELIDTRIKLNETSTLVHEARLQNFMTSKELLNAENEITILKRERAVLKNQLKDRNYKLDVSSQKATECEVKSTDQQDKMVEVNHDHCHQHHFCRLHHHHHHHHRPVITRISTFCGFEDPNLCGFTNINDTSDFFDWERGRGLTPSPGTGPSKDHTCDGPKGHFMYIEASAKGRGSNAILYSPLYRGMSEQCVEFFYHMNGKHIGTLNVYAQPRGDNLKSAWRAYGNQGDFWTSARLAIPQELARTGYQIAFEGITEKGYLGDIAIDDVSVTDGPCPVDEKVVPVRVAINSTKILNPAKAFARKIRVKDKKNTSGGDRQDNDN